jgi:hypothetical protein
MVLLVVHESGAREFKRALGKRAGRVQEVFVGWVKAAGRYPSKPCQKFLHCASVRWAALCTTYPTSLAIMAEESDTSGPGTKR